MEDETEKVDLTPTEKANLKLDKAQRKIVRQLIKSKDADQTKDLFNLFNVNSAKKEVVRRSVIEDTYDTVLNTLGNRVKYKSDEFTNKDLMDALKTLGDARDKSDKILNQAENVEDIKYKQINNISISVEGQEQTAIDRDSENRVIDAVKAVIERGMSLGASQIETYTEIEETVEEISASESDTEEKEELQENISENFDSSDTNLVYTNEGPNLDINEENNLTEDL